MIKKNKMKELKLITILVLFTSCSSTSFNPTEKYFKKVVKYKQTQLVTINKFSNE